jgi:hypothetical protein
MILVYHRSASPRCHYQEFGAVAERLVERLLGAISCRSDGGEGTTPPLRSDICGLDDKRPSDSLSPFIGRDIHRQQPGWVEGEQSEPREAACAFGYEHRGVCSGE